MILVWVISNFNHILKFVYRQTDRHRMACFSNLHDIKCKAAQMTKDLVIYGDNII